METIKDIPAQLRHPIKTKLIQVNLPKTKEARYYFQKGIGHYGMRKSVLELSKLGYWCSRSYIDAFCKDEAMCKDTELLQARKEGKTVLAIIVDYRHTDDNPYIVCILHVEIFNSDASNTEMVQQLIYQLESRHFCPTDEATNILLSTREELNKELAEVKIMKSDLFKETKSYMTRLSNRIGNILQESCPITEETFMDVKGELKEKKAKLDMRIRPQYDMAYQALKKDDAEKTRIASVALTLANTLIDRLVEDVYRKGVAQSKEQMMKAIASVESMMPASFGFHVPQEFIDLKREQLELAYEIEDFKHKQKEERRLKLEAEREEMRAQKELEREQKKAEKDELAAKTAIERNKFELAQAKSKKEIEKYQKQIAALEEALKQAQERKERAISMAQQTRCGYVYIISNIGSFGEGVYKIGMTRRVEPMERVAELGDASVPFPFDVHAMIYTEDAPGLESALHRAFESKKVNSVNWRKEYFRVPLDDIKKEVRKFGIECKWVVKPVAAQYHDSQIKRS